MKYISRIALLCITFAPALPAWAQTDVQAQRSHLLPHVTDGDNWRSTVIVTNASASEANCTLGFNGTLTLDRFETGPGVTVIDSTTAEFMLGAPSGYLTWPTMNGPSNLSSYAKLDCDQAVTAQVVFEYLPGGAARPTGMATVFSSQSGDAFQVPVMNATGTVGVAIANDTNAVANCTFEIEDPQRNSLGTYQEVVMSKTNMPVLLGETQIPLPETFEMGSATIMCDRQVSVVGLHYELGGPTGILTFNTLPPAVVSADDVYAPLEGLSVAQGQVSLSGATLPLECVNNTLASTLGYTVHTSKWQRRNDDSTPWRDIPGTERTEELCRYSGEYRLVGDVTRQVEGESVRDLLSSEDFFTVPAP